MTAEHNITTCFLRKNPPRANKTPKPIAAERKVVEGGPENVLPPWVCSHVMGPMTSEQTRDGRTFSGPPSTTFAFCRYGLWCFVCTWWVFAQKTGSNILFYRHGLFHRYGFGPKPIAEEHFAKPIPAERFKKPTTVERSGLFRGVNFSLFSESRGTPQR